jgi:hypothetical protein
MDSVFARIYEQENHRLEEENPLPSGYDSEAAEFDEDDNTMDASEIRSEAQFLALRAARQAYRSALPPLCGSDNIRDFIACVAHGLLLEVFQGPDASKLRYAAQIANSVSACGRRKNKESCPPTPRGL